MRFPHLEGHLRYVNHIYFKIITRLINDVTVYLITRKEMLPELCDLIPQIEFLLSKNTKMEVLKRSLEIDCILSKREKKKCAHKVSP